MRIKTTLSRQTARGGYSGFSLIELLVVIAVMAILLAVAVPAIKALTQNNSQKQAVNQITAFMASARAIAISYKRQVAVVFFEETATYARPVNSGQTAMQMALEDGDQSAVAYPTLLAGNTVFKAFGAREYIPSGVRVATLNGDLTGNSMSTADMTTSMTRAIVFDANGQMVLRNGLAVPNLILIPVGGTGCVPGDWRFTSLTGAASATPGAPYVAAPNATSSPGVIVYDGSQYINASLSSDAARSAWLRKYADVLIVNAYTGNVIR